MGRGGCYGFGRAHESVNVCLFRHLRVALSQRVLHFTSRRSSQFLSSPKESGAPTPTASSPASSAKLLSRLPLFFLLSGHKTASLYVHSSFRVSCYEALGSPPFVQLKLPPFCLSNLFFFFFFILVLIAVVVCLSWTPYFTPGSLLFGAHRP